MIGVKFLRVFSQHAKHCRDVTGRSHLLLFLDFIKILGKGYYPSEYYGFRIYDREPIGYVQIRRGIEIEKALNPRMTGIVNFDKWQQYCFFKANDLATPDVYGFFCGRRVLVHGTGYDAEDPELRQALSRIPGPFAVKPYGGGHGEGFGVVEAISAGDEKIVLRGRGACSLGDWIGKAVRDPQGLLLQELLVPHPALRRYGETALNTLRIVTVRDAAGVPHAASVLFKMARTGALVDNIGAGALAAHVDLGTGKLSKAFAWPGDGLWDVHPDTGADIEAYELPYWREAITLASQAHERLTSGGSLSWDVALTERGPMLLEMNAFAPRPVYQRLDRGLLGTVYGEVLRQRNIPC